MLNQSSSILQEAFFLEFHWRQANYEGLAPSNGSVAKLTEA
jgi:hypothetical protein